MFRDVTLPQGVQGRLFLHSMPGRCEEWEDFLDAATKHHLQVIVSLAPDDEVHKKSPSYATAIKNGMLGLSRECFPITDYGVPDAQEEYAEFVMRIAEMLRTGKTILVHCGAGIGRTGTFAICLLLALGMDRAQAEHSVKHAASNPETDKQWKFIDWFQKWLTKRQHYA